MYRFRPGARPLYEAENAGTTAAAKGPRGAWQNAHFGQFVAILDEFEQLRAANRAFDPARPVIAANVRPSERDPG
jgi:hypothetical protein